MPCVILKLVAGYVAKRFFGEDNVKLNSTFFKNKLQLAV